MLRIRTQRGMIELADTEANALRVAMPEIPVPFSSILEQAVLPNADAVVAAVRMLLGELRPATDADATETVPQ
jgi:pyruvate/2-oxoglutarate/acetoin dehydrogenase E1 component